MWEKYYCSSAVTLLQQFSKHFRFIALHKPSLISEQFFLITNIGKEKGKSNYVSYAYLGVRPLGIMWVITTLSLKELLRYLFTT